MSSAIRCQFPHFGPMLGYAATARFRSSSTPITGGRYYEQMDWWNYVASIPGPRILVMEDADETPGSGAMVGEVHAVIAKALGCVGHVTNGVVRDLARVEKIGFHLFAGGTVVSHAYAHVVEFGIPVEIGGLKINPGDLLHGDRNGIHSIPLSIAAGVPDMVETISEQERKLIDFCRSPAFSLEALPEKLRETAANHTNGANQ